MRPYSVDEQGDRGVVFLFLDAGPGVAGAPVPVLRSPGVDTDVTVSKPSEGTTHT